MDWMVVSILDSSNLTLSPAENLPDERYTISNLFEPRPSGLSTTLAIILESTPIIFSPIIEFEDTLALLENNNWSNVGADVFVDS